MLRLLNRPPAQKFGRKSIYSCRVPRAGNRGHGWACNLKLNFLRRVRHMSEGCTIGKYKENKNLNHLKSFHEDE